MSSDVSDLDRFLSETCPDCGTPGPQRHLSAAAGCGTCATGDPRPVLVPVCGVLPYDLPRPPQRPPGDTGPCFPPGLGFPSWPAGPYFAPFREGGTTSQDARCYEAAGGFTVHVQPGCRCKR